MTSEKLSDEEARALVFVRELGALDNAAYRSINRTDTLQASAHLRRLRDLGILEMKGSGNRTYYVPGAAMKMRAATIAATPMPGSDPRMLPPDPHQAAADPHQVIADPHQVPPGPAEVPAELRARIAAAGTRPRRDTVRRLIVDICAWRALSARELADLLGDRDPKELVRAHLGPMVEAGQLAYTIPEMPNHPAQRYAIPSPPAEPAP